MKVNFSLKYFLLFTLAFMLFTAIGTVTHEIGHMVVAEALGYTANIDYYSTVYDHSNKTTAFESFLITLGGPLQTMITGTIGLLIIWFRRENLDRFIFWLGIFLSLFWLRPSFNLAYSILHKLKFPDQGIFRGDEAGLSMLLNLPTGTFGILFGLLGLLVGLYIVFKVVPAHLRLTFILSGLLGGISGFILWMKVIGPIVLPSSTLNYS